MARPKKSVEGVFEKNPGSGVWYVRLRVRGKLVRKAIGTHAEAKKYIEKARTIRADGTGVLPTTAKLPMRSKEELQTLGDGTTVRDLCDRYEAHLLHKGNPDRPANPVNALQQLKVIRRDLGGSPAATLRPGEIRLWLKSLMKSAATLNKYKSALSGIYTHAMEEGLVETNPCRSVKHYKVALGLPRWLSEEEEDKLRSVLTQWYDQTPEHHRLHRLWIKEHQNELTVAIGTGMRKGNQYGLTWEMVDFDNRLLLLPTTKPGVPQVIPMTDDVHATLLDQRRIQAEITQIERRMKVTDSTKRVAGGRVFSISVNREWFVKVVRKAKIKHLRWHDLRHTTASRLAISGANQKVIQSVLGHSTMAMSARYTHLNPEHLRTPMAALNRKATTD